MKKKMTIKRALNHPLYKTAAAFARRCGYSGGMDNMEFGFVVMAYLTGFNKGYRDQYENLKETFYFLVKR